MSMRMHKTEVQNDKRVWVRGSNGIECVKWLSKIQHRVDLQILGDYKDGQTEYVEPKKRTPKATKTEE